MPLNPNVLRCAGVALVATAALGACSASAQSACVHLNNFKICRTPTHGGSRVCTTVYLENGISFTRCRTERR
jgi:hypothetical protein